jgi:hypothetical protein
MCLCAHVCSRACAWCIKGIADDNALSWVVHNDTRRALKIESFLNRAYIMGWGIPCSFSAMA